MGSSAEEVSAEGLRAAPPESPAGAPDDDDDDDGLGSDTSGDGPCYVPRRDPYSAPRRNSQAAFAEKMHTTLILDWDDTIFPTTWIKDDCALSWKLPLAAQLSPGPRMELITELLAKLTSRVHAFLSEASLRANIFIVTLARRPWVERSLENFAPGLSQTVSNLDLKVIYAQDYVEGSSARELYSRDPTSEEAAEFWTHVKANAIAKELEVFHASCNASWKNVISFGDSDFERFGTIAAGKNYMTREMQNGGKVRQTGHTAESISRDGHFKRLRTKTIKLLNEPTVEELTAELNLLTRWLPYIVRRDSGFDIEINSTEDDAKLREIHGLITGGDGSSEGLTWRELAGMAPAPPAPAPPGVSP